MVVLLGALLTCLATAQDEPSKAQAPRPESSKPQVSVQTQNDDQVPGIQDNSFLLEEAYNQEFGVVQHIQSFQRLWNAKTWVYSFTQEWPLNPAPKSQLSYTILGLDNGAGAGIGDIALNYRYQLVGNGKTKYAFSPRFSVLVPTGDYKLGRGAGGTGIQINLPVSVAHNKRVTTHWNAGATFIPSQKNPAGNNAATQAVNLGQSFIFTVHPRINLMLETVYARTENVIATNVKQGVNSLFVNPGIRWSYNLKSGMQIVPGVSVPIGAGPSRGDYGILFYFSVEHPFRKLTSGKK